jgi:hypothetical protein
MEMSSQLQAPARFTPGIHCIRGWVGTRSGLDAMEKRKILLCQESNIGHRYDDWAIPASDRNIQNKQKHPFLGSERDLIPIQYHKYCS